MKVVVLSDEHRRQSTDDEIHTKHDETINTLQVSDQANHDTYQSVGDTHDEDEQRRPTSVKTNLNLPEIRQVDERYHVRDTAEEVAQSEHDEHQVSQQSPVEVLTA